jgi:hypothetical protein
LANPNENRRVSIQAKLLQRFQAKLHELLMSAHRWRHRRRKSWAEINRNRTALIFFLVSSWRALGWKL